MKPFIIFQGAKREVAVLNEEFKNRCVVTSSSNRWMNEELTLMYLKKVVGPFSFQKRLLAWDTFEAHMTEPVKQLLKEMRIDDALIPDGCTKYIQAPDVFWNKPFKGRIMEFYDEWLASGMHYYTEAGNMKPASRRLIVTWILEAWNLVDKELISRSFKSCALNLKNDGSEDNMIHCFKNGQPCSACATLLQDQVHIINNDDVVNAKPFDVTDSDVDEATLQENLVDESENEDDFVDID